MLDAIFRSRSVAPLAPAADRLAALGIHAMGLTLATFACGVTAMLDIGHRNYLFGLGFLVGARLLDVLDGPVARREGATPFGAYLDLVLDLIVSAAVPFAFALAEPDRTLAAMFLMLGLVARAGAVTGAAQLEKPGLVSAVLGQAGLLVGKSELFVAFALACIFPNWFSLIAYIVGILCFLTAGSRVVAVAALGRP